jgi:multidrug efflux pump
VLVGGMAIGTFFTLFVIPSIYMLVARDHAKDLAQQTATETGGETTAKSVFKPQASGH